MKYESVLYIEIAAKTEEAAIQKIEEMKEELEGLHNSDRSFNIWRGDVGLVDE